MMAELHAEEEMGHPKYRHQPHEVYCMVSKPPCDLKFLELKTAY